MNFKEMHKDSKRYVPIWDLQWMKAIADLKAAIPPEEDDDPYRELCARGRALRILLNGGSALAHPPPTAAAHCRRCSFCRCSRVRTR